MTQQAHRILIGIAGGSGSGKTLVAKTIYRELGSDRVVIIDQDSYYKDLDDVPIRERDQRNFDHPEAFDYGLMKQQMRDLLDGKTVHQPIYDYTRHARTSEGTTPSMPTPATLTNSANPRPDGRPSYNAMHPRLMSVA